MAAAIALDNAKNTTGRLRSMRQNVDAKSMRITPLEVSSRASAAAASIPWCASAVFVVGVIRTIGSIMCSGHGEPEEYPVAALPYPRRRTRANPVRSWPRAPACGSLKGRSSNTFWDGNQTWVILICRGNNLTTIRCFPLSNMAVQRNANLLIPIEPLRTGNIGQ